MEYTEQMQDILFSSLDYDCGDEDYSNVLDVLNHDFRSFGEGLTWVMEKKLDQEIDDPIILLKEECSKHEVPISAIGSPNSLKNWFKGEFRPKKGDGSRRKLFAFAFALDLTIDETKELFHKVYLDRSFNQRDYRELIYFYCLTNRLNFNIAEELIEVVSFDNIEASDETVYTTVISKDIERIQRNEDLIKYIQSHGHNFSINSKSAKSILVSQKALALENAKKQKHSTAYDDELFRGKTEKSDGFLYSAITNRIVAGNKGTITIPFKNTVFPKEIKNNFPQVKSLSEKIESYEELRKVIILLFSYNFWNEIPKDAEMNDEIYENYIERLGLLLMEANLPPMYYGNPYDWLFMYCTFSENPFDTFQGILSDVLDNDEW